MGREEREYSTIPTLGKRHLPVFPSAGKQDYFLKFSHLSKLFLPPWTWWRNLVPKSLRESWWVSPSITTLPPVTLRDISDVQSSQNRREGFLELNLEIFWMSRHHLLVILPVVPQKKGFSLPS